MQSHRFQSFVPLFAILAAVVTLSVGTSLAKQLFPVIGAQGTSALRVGFSALLLLLLWRPWRWSLSRADALSIVRYGATLGCMNLLFYMALRTIPFGIAVAIEFAGPLAVALWSSRRGVDFVWIALAVVGLLLLLPLELDGDGLDPIGTAYALGAAVCWGLYIVFGKRTGHLHSGHTVSLGMTMAALIVVPVGVAHAGTALLDPGILLFGLGIAVLSSAIPISLEMVALRRLPKETFGILISMEPAVAALIALPLLGEHLSPLQWVAIGCTMLASMGSTATARRPAAVQRQVEAEPG